MAGRTDMGQIQYPLMPCGGGHKNNVGKARQYIRYEKTTDRTVNNVYT